MEEISKSLIALERALTPGMRWSLTALFAIAGLNYALDFGERLGRALYYLMH